MGKERNDELGSTSPRVVKQWRSSHDHRPLVKLDNPMYGGGLSEPIIFMMTGSYGSNSVLLCFYHRGLSCGKPKQTIPSLLIFVPCGPSSTKRVLYDRVYGSSYPRNFPRNPPEFPWHFLPTLGPMGQPQKITWHVWNKALLRLMIMEDYHFHQTKR